MGKVAMINGRLIDGTGKEPREGWGLVADGSKILSGDSTNTLRIPADAQVIDVDGMTLMSAKAIGQAEAWGTLEPDKASDLLVVDADPSKDVSILRDKSRIKMVFQDGKVPRISGARTWLRSEDTDPQ